MAIIKNDTVSYVGQVINFYDHTWSDGMMEEYAVVWNPKTHTTEDIQVGYYGADGRNLMNISARVDYTDDIVRDAIETMRREAEQSFRDDVDRRKRTVIRGDHVRVIRGRKIPKGTELTVFWIGDRPDYTGYRTETIAGCKDKTGCKVWIKYDYLETLETRPEPTSDERDSYIDDYVNRHIRKLFGGRVQI